MTALGNKEVLARNLRYYIERSGKDRRALAEIWGFPYSTVTEWINARKYPRIDRIEIMADYFGIPKSALIEDYPHPNRSILALDGNIASPVQLHRIPLLGAIRCGEPEFAEESFEGYIESGFQCDFALRAKGDSMIGARIQDGDVVFIRKQDTVEDGQIAAVILDDDATLKRVRYLPGGMTMLQAENSKYPPIIIGGAGETRTARILGLAVAFQSVVQ